MAAEGMDKHVEAAFAGFFEPQEEVVLSREEAMRVMQNHAQFTRSDAAAMQYASRYWEEDDFHIIVPRTLAARIRMAAQDRPRIVWRNV